MNYKENVKFDLHLGEAGSGKSHTIADMMIKQAKTSIYGVLVIVPTNSARQNLANMLLERTVSENSQLIYDLIDKIQVKYLKTNYKDEVGLLIIDEVGLVSTNELHDIMDQFKQQKSDLTISMFGDANQLAPTDSVSVLQSIIEYNYSPEKWQEWTKQHQYSDSEWNRLYLPPKFIEINDNLVQIKVVKHLKNYRFDNTGELSQYSGYSDPEFMNDLINSSYEIGHNTIDSDLIDKITKDYQTYTSELIIKYNVPVTVPTNALIDEVNDGVRDYCEANDLKYSEVSMFVHVKGDSASKLYLNPKHKDIEELKNTFAFNVADSSLGRFEYRNAMTVHSCQGQSFNSVAYYLGVHQIPTKGKSKYFYNYSQFFTAISRSRKYFYLVGEKETFRNMLTLFPNPVKQKAGNDNSTSIKVTMGIIEDLQTQKLVNINYSPKAIYEIFNQRYNEADKLPNSKQFTQYKFISYFKDYKPNVDTFGYVDYKYLVDENLHETKSKGAKGKGKVQVWLNSLSDKELEDVRNDLNELSRSKFKAKYGFINTSVKSHL